MFKTHLGFNNELQPDLSLSKGIKLIDKKGNQWIDIFGNYSSLPFGHNYKPIKDHFIEKSHLFSERSPLCAFNHSEVNLFSNELKKIVGNNFHNISFAENGGLANEQIIKSFLYKGFIEKKKVKFFVIGGSYHGIAGLSLNLTKVANSAFNRTNFIKDSTSLEVELFDNKNDDYLFDKNYLNVFFVEPLKCTKGDESLSQEIIYKIKKIKENNNCILIYDEIQTGLYPLLKMWGYQYFNLPDPDIITFGKRFQVSGFISNESLALVFDNDSPKILSSTFDGSLIDLTRGTFLIKHTKDFVETNKNRILKNLDDLKENLLNSLEKYECKLSIFGTYISIKFKDDLQMNEYSKFLTNKLILHNPTPPRSIRFRPPLNISDEEIELLKNRLIN